MKTLGIMQPYLFPYLGYFQLIDSVDTFVFFDDVNYIKKGWINRNYILVDNNKYMWTLPLIKTSQNKKINEHEIFEPKKTKEKLSKLIYKAYEKAPNFKSVFPLINSILSGSEILISEIALKSIFEITNYLNLNKTFKRSSDLINPNKYSSYLRIIDIIKLLNCSKYINPIGGYKLYDKLLFKKNGIELQFIETSEIFYKQYNNNFIPNLSMIDVLMFNNIETIKFFLKEYKLK